MLPFNYLISCNLQKSSLKHSSYFSFLLLVDFLSFAFSLDEKKKQSDDNVRFLHVISGFLIKIYTGGLHAKNIRFMVFEGGF
jgi:hypothetical protein